jgi:hypothetical protein
VLVVLVGRQQLRLPQTEHTNPGQQTKRQSCGQATLPSRDTSCRLPPPLSVKLSAALSVPDALGLNVTLMLQLAFDGNDVPQVCVWAKAPALAPVMAIPVMFKLVVPTLVSVTFCGGLVV